MNNDKDDMMTFGDVGNFFGQLQGDIKKMPRHARKGVEQFQGDIQRHWVTLKRWQGCLTTLRKC